MMQDHLSSTNADSTLNEHARILPKLEQLSHTIKWLEPSDPDPRVVDEVMAEVREVRQEVAEHFEAEERIRLHNTLLQLVPDASSEIERLRMEHQEVLDRLLEAENRAQRGSSVQIEQVRDDLETVLEMLFAHEAIEDQLMVRAFGAGHAPEGDDTRVFAWG